MFVDKTGRRGPCPREIPLFGDTLSLRWIRDCYGQPINWASMGLRPPRVITPNAPPDAEWLRRIRVELRIPDLRIESCRVAAGYSITISLPATFKLLSDVRAVVLVGLGLEHEHREGMRLTAGQDCLSARLGRPVYALVGALEYESDRLLDWTWLDELEDARTPWADELATLRP
jgi:hypothetical protein